MTRNLPIYGVGDWLEKRPLTGVLIRHDVDRLPRNAEHMAKLEADLGLRTTYYFRVKGKVWSPRSIRFVYELGHEIGYHYEDLAKSRGNILQALDSFKQNLDKVRTVAPVKTIAMHGSPISKYSNLDLWKSNELSKFGLRGEAFMTVDYTEMYYFTDTGRSWGTTSANLRDFPRKALLPPKKVRGSKDLKDFIRANDLRKIAINAHPERWSYADYQWPAQLSRDYVGNFVKEVLHNVRK